MTTTDMPLELTVSRRIAAAPERVFDAWLDPATLARFMTPGPGMTVPKAETHPRVGGRFDIVMQAGEREIPHWGIYETIDRPRRLVFSWQSPFSTEGSTVTLDFAPDGDGTQVTLHHARFPDAESRDNHKSGWTAILGALAEAMA